MAARANASVCKLRNENKKMQGAHPKDGEIVYIKTAKMGRNDDTTCRIEAIARWKAEGRLDGDATHPFISKPLPLRSSPSAAAVDVAMLRECAFSSRTTCSGCDVVTAMDCGGRASSRQCQDLCAGWSRYKVGQGNGCAVGLRARDQKRWSCT